MTCKEARKAILEVDPAELEGIGETELARHLGECSRCRELAGVVLAGETLLASELTRAVPPLDLEHILVAGHGSASPSLGDPSPRLHQSMRRASFLRVPRSAPLWASLPLALAAGLAALLLFRGPSPLPGPVFVPPADARGVEVEAPPDRSVAILATEDPNLVVIWLFPPSEEP